MTGKAFTLLELLAAALVLTILVSLAVVSYGSYRDRVSTMVDRMNQKILATAVRVNASDTGIVAGNLSRLTPGDLQRAYALVIQEEFPSPGAFWGSSIAYAESFLPARYYNRDLKILVCTSDKTPPTGFDENDRPIGGISYGIHPEAAHKPYGWLLEHPGEELIIETDNGVSTVARHRKGLFGPRRMAVVTTVTGESLQVEVR